MGNLLISELVSQDVELHDNFIQLAEESIHTQNVIPPRLFSCDNFAENEHPPPPRGLSDQKHLI